MSLYKIKSISPLPEYMQVFAEYIEDNGTLGYDPVYFMGMVEYDRDNGIYPAFFTVNADGVFDLADDVDNFSKIVIFDKRPSKKVTTHDNDRRPKSKEIVRPTQAPKMLSIRQTSEETGLSYEALRKMIHENKITFIKCGKKYLINFTSLMEYLNAGGRW